MIKIFIGYDPREAIVYHVFNQSIIEHASIPIQVTPLALSHLQEFNEQHTDRSNDFVYSRFLTPYLSNFHGWAIYADGDMVCKSDIKELLDYADPEKAVLVVKHNYKTKANQKYLGNFNENYPRKNWSSLILWNCEHKKNKILTPEFVEKKSGSYLHRFSWLDDQDIGSLPLEWNWLAIEYADNPKAKLVHYTLGAPCFADYKDTEMSQTWHEYNSLAQKGFG